MDTSRHDNERTPDRASDDSAARVIYTGAQIARMADAVITLTYYFSGLHHGRAQYDGGGARITPTLAEAEKAVATLGQEIGSPVPKSAFREHAEHRPEATG